MKSLIKTFKTNPQKLFLFDGAGAILTASLLTFVLAPNESFFGMPSYIVYVLAAVSCMLIIYSFGCYIIQPKNPKPFIQLLSLFNSLYSLTTFILLLKLYNQLTVWGLLYFGGELIVLALLIYIEIQVSRSIKTTIN
jgi:hypothetical protein